MDKYIQSNKMFILNNTYNTNNINNIKIKKKFKKKLKTWFEYKNANELESNTKNRRYFNIKT